MLFIEVPNIKFIEYYILKLLGINKFLFLMEHLIHFSPKTLKTVINETGFSINEMICAGISPTIEDYKTLIEAVFMYVGRVLSFTMRVNISHGIWLAATKK